QLLEGELLADAGVVDQQAHASPGARRRGQRVHSLEILEVGAHALGLSTQSGGELDRLLRVLLPAAIAEDDVEAAPSRLEHESAPDPARPTGDDRQRARLRHSESFLDEELAGE